MQVRNVTKVQVLALNVLKCLLYLEAVTWLSAYLIYSQKNTMSAIKAAESWSGKVPTRAGCTLLLPIVVHAAPACSAPCPSDLASDSVLYRAGEYPVFAQGAASCIPVLLSSSTAQASGLGTLGPAPNHIFTLPNGSISLQSSASHGEKLSFAPQFFTMRLIL